MTPKPKKTPVLPLDPTQAAMDAIRALALRAEKARENERESMTRAERIEGDDLSIEDRVTRRLEAAVASIEAQPRRKARKEYNPVEEIDPFPSDVTQWKSKRTGRQHTLWGPEDPTPKDVIWADAYRLMMALHESGVMEKALGPKHWSKELVPGANQKQIEAIIPMLLTRGAVMTELGTIDPKDGLWQVSYWALAWYWHYHLHGPYPERPIFTKPGSLMEVCWVPGYECPVCHLKTPPLVKSKDGSTHDELLEYAAWIKAHAAKAHPKLRKTQAKRIEERM